MATLFPSQVSSGLYISFFHVSEVAFLHAWGTEQDGIWFSCRLGFQGWMKLGCSLRLLRLIIFNVRPKVIFNEAPLSMGFPKQEYWSRNSAIPSSRGSSQHRDQTLYCRQILLELFVS